MKKLKYIVLVADGMADYPLEELGGKTPLEVARTTNMDFLAQQGKVGITCFVPKGMTPGSDIANLSIFGYDPVKYFSGRGPLEALNIGIDLKDDEVAFRCNFITVENDKLVDYSAGHITTKEALVLIKTLNKTLGAEDVRFYAGVSYRHLMVVRGAVPEFLNIKCYPPHDIMGENIPKHLPKTATAENEKIIQLMGKSKNVLSEHEINLVRIDLKENPANMIWLWGQGKKVQMPTFRQKYGLEGSVISAVDLIKGIGIAAGLTPIAVPGVTGYYDTNYEGKAEYALEALKDKDFIFVHVEAPDEAGHNADTREKIKAIENFDRYVVGKILAEFKDRKDEVRILVLPDHPTPISLRTHTADPICFVMFGAGIESNGLDAFNENLAQKSKYTISVGHDLMESFLKKENI
ncbi:MAG: cofactor-independent phosphoglycerate mutase [Candidatus Omnitrophica bacterium]|nr:cofactor-independent phosphoglycerate mutase [Candidatus Omnitrophota bacterium]MBU1925545.1 cofactor-independent phosphoglycerate mutase [Candidatus Omnitrophota bacterium]